MTSPSDSADSSPTAKTDLKQRYDLILESVGEGVYGLDLNGHTTFVNSVAAELLGWEMEDLRGKAQHNIIHHSHADGSAYPAHTCPIYAAFTDGSVHQVHDEVFWRKDGTSIFVEYVSTPILDNEGELTGAVVTFRDVTERRKEQNKLRDALAEVERLKDQLQAENRYLRQEIAAGHGWDDMIGKSAVLLKAKHRVEQVAGTDATVLVRGETGVGKERFARAIHDLSKRRKRPLIKLNCAALPSTLIESELFGHEKGAYTGASAQRIGRFELADQGTIFLDEVGELSLDVQAKLLRVLQEGEFERVGGSRTIKADIRIVAATNRDLTKAVWAGDFRDDLYYRLNVFPVEVPPLRDRKDDIPDLVTHFVTKYTAKLGRPIDTIPKEALKALQAYAWPGNIRELENVVERAVILSGDGVLRVDEALDPQPIRSARASGSSDPRTLEDVERDHIRAVLKQSNWRIEGQSGAALILGLHPNTLRSRMKKMGIRKDTAS